MKNSNSNNLVPNHTPEVSLAIIVVTYNRLNLLLKLLESLEAAQQSLVYPIKISLIIYINGVDHETEKHLKEWNQNKNNTQLIVNQISVSPGEARNRAASLVTSDWLAFFDDDIKISEDFFNNLYKLLQIDRNAVIWGGPNLTESNSSIVQKKIGWYLESFLVTGPLAKRYKKNTAHYASANETHLCLCNMLIKTDLFKKLNFSSHLRTAEENELIFKAAKENCLIMTSDLLAVWHARRETYGAFLKQIQNYGYGRGQLIYAGYTSKKILIGSIVSLIFLGWLSFACTIQIVIVTFLWLSICFVNINISFKFATFNYKDFLMPALIHLNYLYGILKSLKESFFNRHSLNQTKV